MNELRDRIPAEVPDCMPTQLGKRAVHASDIYLSQIPKINDSHVQYCTRPVVVVSNDRINGAGGILTVVLLTSQRKKLAMPGHVYLSSDVEGHKQLRCDSIALCDHVQTIDKRQLVAYIGSVGGEFERMAIRHALAVHFNLIA